ncbi:hypothetical protein XFUD_01530 [Xylella fastidiosa]|nr:hypothetical protein XFUD_01530 [Xylella fastidiosa]ETE35662.1 hypothetical protein B398_01570 [Xylella fastidiosa 32]OCA58839.1 hypothetical protein AA93_01535 [Xylella fastidiosa subsp. pauca 11399]OJZ72348.1 hypothetical protein B375_0201460 [Xylella fastidiosa 6c]ALR08141.2 hypothetical protein XFFB_01530 [Xylella fastidiosa]
MYRYTRKTVESIITRTFGLEATQKRTKPKQKNSNKKQNTDDTQYDATTTPGTHRSSAHPFITTQALL